MNYTYRNKGKRVMGFFSIIITILFVLICYRTKMETYKIDGKTWKEFERFCSQTLQRNGYKIIKEYSVQERHGVDIFAELNGKTYAIQCKSYKNPIGSESVIEANSGKKYCGADMAVIMTNSTFHNQTIALARQYGVILWNGNKIRHLLWKADNKENKEKMQKEKKVMKLKKENSCTDGCYIVGTDIEPGNYIFTPLENDDIGITIKIYESYEKMLDEKNSKHIYEDKKYRIPLIKNGMVVEIHNGIMEKEE